MRSLGLDIGTVRIGVALSDALGQTAQPLTVIERDERDGDLKKIEELIGEHEVGEVVIGLPLAMSGDASSQTRAVTEYVARLERVVGVPIRLWDERLSSVAAERLMISANVKRSKRKKNVDKLAAAIILQGFLDARRMASEEKSPG